MARDFGDMVHHLMLRKGDVGRYVLLPGDPGRTDVIAKYFEDAKLVATNREYRTFTGKLLGEKVSVVSTGIGCPSTAIAIEELVMIGADTFIRVGTSGGMQPEQEPGELAIVTGAIRDEGTSLHYMPPEFPAVADIEVVVALQEAAKRTGARHRLGVSHSKDSFYGQHQPERMPVADRLMERWKAWKMGGAISSEMEAAIILILSSIYRTRAGGIMLVAANQESKSPERRIVEDLDELIRTSIEALKILIEQDRKSKK
jgi:uridine phosphorylase